MMALGIGANTAVFSVVDAVILQPLPYGHADALVALWERTPESPRASVSVANLRDYAQLDDVFASLAAYTPAQLVVGAGESAVEVPAQRVTWNLWDVLDVPAATGRLFMAADAEYGAGPTVVVSHAFAERRFGGSAGAIGSAIDVDGIRRTVIGVLPAGFRALTRGGPAIDLFVPAPPASVLASRGDPDVRVVGRLEPGITITEAQAALDRVSTVLAREHPETNGRVVAIVASLSDDARGTARRALLALLAAVGLVVLIACVNVSILLLVWATALARDVAFRVSRGA
jgi:putative ABC transport system permease protein